MNTLTEQTSEPRGGSGTRHRWTMPLGLSVAFLLFWQVAPRIRDDGVTIVVASTILSLVLVLWIAAAVARNLTTVRSMVGAAVISAIVIVPMRWAYAVGQPLPPWSWVAGVSGAPDLGFIWFAAALGALLSLVLRGVNMIPPVAAVLALVDVWTVLLGGPVQQVMQSQAPAARQLTAAMTVTLPAPTSGAAPMSLVGFADFLFVAFFVAGMCRFVDEPRIYQRTIVPLVLVLAGYMVLVSWRGMDLPALVPIAVTMIAVHWRRFRYARSEAFALLYAGLCIGVIIAVFWWMSGRGEPPT